MTTIRPSPFAQTQVPQGQVGGGRDEGGKLAAQRAFFAAIQAQGVAAPKPAAAPAATVATATTASQPGPAPVSRMAAAQPAEAPQKILRPGSLLDIRV